MTPAIFGLSGPTLNPDERAFFRESDPAGYILFGRNIETRAQVRALTDDLRAIHGRDKLLISVDQEGGRVARMKPPACAAFPAGEAFAALYAIAPASAIEAARCNAMLLARLRGGPAAMRAREALEMATLGGAACLGRDDIGAIEVGRQADLAIWRLRGVAFAGAHSDPVEALLRCGPVSANHTIVAGVPIVTDGQPVHPGVDDVLRRHDEISRDWLAAATS